jgi:hypothetical protein
MSVYKSFSQTFPLVFPNGEIICCGAGWHDLLHDLCSSLERLISELPEGERQAYYAVQVKEKFGGLRFYMSLETKDMSDAIDKAEERSETTCEACGRPGEIGGKHWLQCRCEACRSKM